MSGNLRAGRCRPAALQGNAGLTRARTGVSVSRSCDTAPWKAGAAGRAGTLFPGLLPGRGAAGGCRPLGLSRRGRSAGRLGRGGRPGGEPVFYGASPWFSDARKSAPPPSGGGGEDPPHPGRWACLNGWLPGFHKDAPSPCPRPPAADTAGSLPSRPRCPRTRSLEGVGRPRCRGYEVDSEGGGGLGG